MPHAQIQSPSFETRPARQQGLTLRLVRVVTDAMTRRQNRMALAHLDAHLLRDIGLSADDARSESAKHFWQE